MNTVTVEICLYRAEDAGAVNWQEHLNGNVGKLLEAMHGLALK